MLRSQKALARNDSDKGKRWPAVSVLIVLLVIVAGCGPSWQATVVAPDGGQFAVDRQVLEDLERFAEEDAEGVPLEQVLWTAGHQAVETVAVVDDEGARHEYDWAEVALEAQWLPGGMILVAGEELDAARVEVEPPALLTRVTADIPDVAPTAAAGLERRAGG